MKPSQTMNSFSRRDFLKGLGISAVTLSATGTAMAHPAAAPPLAPPPLTEKNWTIMAFIAGASQLNHAARDGLLQMKQVGSTDRLNLIAQFDSGSEGSTKRYFIGKPSNESELAKIEKAREKFSQLAKEGALANLNDEFEALKCQLQNESMTAAELFVELQNPKYKIVVENQGQPLSGFFDTLLPGPNEKLSFQNRYLKTENDQEKLLGNPLWLIPFLFDCFFESENTPIQSTRECDIPPAPRSTSTGNPLVLRNFLDWGTTCYPSKYKMVIIKGHGDGMSVAWDATLRHTNLAGNELDRLRAVELREAFSLPKEDLSACFHFFDIVGFNACLMGMVEVYHKLRHYVGYGIASEGPTPFASWPFFNILRKLDESNPSMEPKALAETILDEYMKLQVGFEDDCKQFPDAVANGDCTIDLSICDLFQLGDVVDALGMLTDELIRILRRRPTKLNEAQAIIQAREQTQFYLDGDYVDLPHFCKQLINEFGSQTPVGELCKKVIDAVEKMTPTRSTPPHNNHTSSVKNSNGLSIYFPKTILSSRYARSLEIKEVPWADFLHAYLGFKKEGVIEVLTKVDPKSEDSPLTGVTIKWDAYSNKVSPLSVDLNTKVTIRSGVISKEIPVELADLISGQKVTIVKRGKKTLGTVKGTDKANQTVNIVPAGCVNEVSLKVGADTEITSSRQDISEVLSLLIPGQTVTIIIHGVKHTGTVAKPPVENTVEILEARCNNVVPLTVPTGSKISIDEVPIAQAHLFVGQKVTVESDGDRALELLVSEF